VKYKEEIAMAAAEELAKSTSKDEALY